MGVAAVGDEVADGESAGRVVLLCEQAEFAGELFRRAVVDCGPVEQNGAGVRGQLRGEPLQQRGFAGAVGAHERRDFAGGHDDVRAVDDGGVAVPEFEVGAEHCGRLHGVFVGVGVWSLWHG